MSTSTRTDHFLEDEATAPPSSKGLPAPFTNGDLCQSCNQSLHLDDSVVRHCLKTSPEGQEYLGGLGATFDNGYYFAGIDYVRTDFATDLVGLTSTASSGCRFCAAVKETLQREYRDSSWWRDGEEICVEIQYKWQIGRGQDPTYIVAVVVSVSHRGKRESLIEFPIHAFEGNVAPISISLSCIQIVKSDIAFCPLDTDQEACNSWLKPPQQQVWSAKNISVVQSWIQDCSCGHPPKILLPSLRDEDIEGRNKLPFVPTRLLDLSPSLSDCKDHFTKPDKDKRCAGDMALVDGHSAVTHSESPKDQLKYAALSYCWGTKDPSIKLDTNTLDVKLQCIAFSDLPECLRDAVTVTRSLGIRYLWIDVLCIVQDDVSDWEQESGKMYEVFNNAFFVIGAAASEAFDHGFLGCRSSPNTIALDFQSHLQPAITGKICLSLTPTGGKQRCLGYDIEVSKWATRGWVWQEERLARRILIFGATMIYMRCDHDAGLTRSEDGGSSVVRTAFGETSPHKETRDGWDWTRRVAEYSGKELTKLNDRLPAISGLAKMMDQNSRRGGEQSSEYMAGIWREDWCRQLCWVLTDQEQSFQDMLEGLRNPEPRTGPSWSWASRRGRVEWLSMLHGHVPSEFEARIEECGVTQAGADPMGQVDNGSYLRLSGLLCQTPLEPEGGRRLRRQRVDMIGGSQRWQLEWKVPGCPLFYTPDWKLESEGGEKRDQKQEIRLFMLYLGRSTEKEEFMGLLLVEGEKGIFYRVGSFSLGDLGVESFSWGDLTPDPPDTYGYGKWTKASIVIA